jgi:hypothetical protein
MPVKENDLHAKLSNMKEQFAGNFSIDPSGGMVVGFGFILSRQI